MQICGKTVCDHIWFTTNKQFERLSLREGDVIQFRARVGSYIKGYRGWTENGLDNPIEKDWKLKYPTHVVKIDGMALPEGDLFDGIL